MSIFLIDPHVTSIQLMYAYPLIDAARDVLPHLLNMSFPPRCRPDLPLQKSVNGIPFNTGRSQWFSEWYLEIPLNTTQYH